MIAVDINVVRDTAEPALQEQLKKADSHSVATYVSAKVATHWRDHLKNLPRNKAGYPSSGFWESAARSVVGVAVGGTAVISADKLGLRQRLYGGQITARNVKNLTIPICAEAYGTTAADWGDNLVLVILSDGRKFLALWLGSEVAQSAYSTHLSKLTKRAETTAKKVGRFRAAVALAPGTPKPPPKVIVFKGKGIGSGAAQASRAARTYNLKFLFVLKQSVEQAGNPLVLPPDLQEFAIQQVKDAVAINK